MANTPTCHHKVVRIDRVKSSSRTVGRACAWMATSTRALTGAGAGLLGQHAGRGGARGRLRGRVGGVRASGEACLEAVGVLVRVVQVQPYDDQVAGRLASF